MVLRPASKPTLTLVAAALFFSYSQATQALNSHRITVVELPGSRGLLKAVSSSRVLCGLHCVLQEGCTTVLFNSTLEPSCIMLGCTADWSVLGRSCFFVEATRVRPEEADQRCEELRPGARLASIASEDENRLVTQLINHKADSQMQNNPTNSGAFIGLLHKPEFGTVGGKPAFRWVDGSPMGYEKWMPEQTTSNQQLYGWAAQFGGRWVYSTKDGDHRFFVCKYTE